MVTTVPSVRAQRLRLQVAAICVVALGVAAAPVQQTPSPAAGSGFLMGRVVDARSGASLAGAEVTLSGGTRSPVRLLTNASGDYLFRSLPAGRYTITASTPGFVPGGYGQRRPAGSTQSIELVNNDEKRGDLTIRLWPHGGLSGTVTDDDGEPVGGCEVRVFRRTLVNGSMKWSAVGTSAGNLGTDDRGRYRISDLGPGDYVIGVLSVQTTMPAATADAYLQQVGMSSSELARELRDSGAPAFPMLRQRVGNFAFQSGRPGGLSLVDPAPDGRIFVYPTVFYPAGATVTQASVVTLAVGEHRTGIDIRLRRTPTVRVSGSLVGPNGPIQNFGVQLLPAGVEEFRQEDGMHAAHTVSDTNGEFTFLGVTPGRYTVKALRIPRPETGNAGSAVRAPVPSAPTLWGRVPVDVGNVDVTGVALTLRQGSQVSGRLQFDGMSPPPAPAQLARATIAITPVSGVIENAVNNAYKRVEPDGRFASAGLPPGKYWITGSLPGSDGSTWRFRATTVAGRDVTDEGLSIDGSDVTNVLVTLTDRRTQVSGVAIDAAGRPDADASVVAFPADVQSWKQGSVGPQRIRSARAATNGVYTLADLPPGIYFVAAVKDDVLDGWQDTRTLEAMSRIAIRVTLRDGESVSQNVTTRSIR